MSKHVVAIAAITGILSAVSLSAATKPTKVELKDASGQSVGTAVITADKSGSGVSIKLDVHGLTAGEHAVHIHQNAKCEAPGFTTRGQPLQSRHEAPRVG